MCYYKTIFFRIISSTFSEKAELDQQLTPNMQHSDYVKLIDGIWQPLVEKAYSFVIKDEQNQIVGVALNFDANDEPEIPFIENYSIIFDFLNFVEASNK